MGYPLTLDLFRSLFKIEQRGNKLHYSAKVMDGTTVVVLDLSDLKYYFDRTIWVKVPLTTDHPYHYNLSVYWTTPVLNPPLTMNEVRKLTLWRGTLFFNFRGGQTSSPSWSTTTSGSITWLCCARSPLFPWLECQPT